MTKEMLNIKKNIFLVLVETWIHLALWEFDNSL